MTDETALEDVIGWYAHWRYETPPPRRGRRWWVSGAVMAGGAVVVGTGYWVVDYWTSVPPEPQTTPRAAFGYFTPDLLRPGDCFNDRSLEGAVRSGRSEGRFKLPAVTVVPCRRPHSAEVFLVLQVDVSRTAPTEAELDRAAAACVDALPRYVADGSTAVDVWHSPPRFSPWEQNSPNFVCLAVDPSAERRPGSLAQPAVGVRPR